eukprot:5071302-Pyramimonas_sp.AAC.1
MRSDGVVASLSARTNLHFRVDILHHPTPPLDLDGGGRERPARPRRPEMAPRGQSPRLHPKSLNSQNS